MQSQIAVCRYQQVVDAHSISIDAVSIIRNPIQECRRAWVGELQGKDGVTSDNSIRIEDGGIKAVHLNINIGSSKYSTAQKATATDNGSRQYAIAICETGVHVKVEVGCRVEIEVC